MAQFEYWPPSFSTPAAPMTPPMMPFDTATVRDPSDDIYGSSSLAFNTLHPYVPSQYPVYDTPPGPSYKGYPQVPEPLPLPVPAVSPPRLTVARAPKLVDMNMAQTGSQAAMAGIHTPLAQYTGES
jgi:hypothetical protein